MHFWNNLAAHVFHLAGNLGPSSATDVCRTPGFDQKVLTTKTQAGVLSAHPIYGQVYNLRLRSGMATEGVAATAAQRNSKGAWSSSCCSVTTQASSQITGRLAKRSS